MAQINQLSTASSLVGTDLIAIFSSENWDARKTSLNALLQLFQEYFAAPNVAVQAATPTNAFNIAIASGNVNTWLLLQPAGGLLSGTITLPLNTDTADGTEITISSTQLIQCVAFSLNGATAIYGAPGALSGTTPVKIRYYQPYNSWYAI